MRFSDVIAASLVAPMVAAHGSQIPGAPKIFGLRGGIEGLRARVASDKHAKRVAQPASHKLNARQGGQDGRCGAEFGGASCDPGYCCSSAGWCGQGYDFCFAPDCQFQYGPGCDANQLPSGGSTREIARPQLGSVPYGGEGIYDCVEPGTVAITYDDGPYIYTNDVLDQFAAYGFKATFFITGINIGKGAIDDESKPWAAMIRRMIAEGHQVASHTWSHQNLDQITKEQRYDQMVKNEMAFSNILGKFPTYMRPPYSACSAGSGCPNDMRDLGYVVSYFDLDTDDYNNVTPELIQNAKNNFANAINPSNPASDEFLAIGHDIHQQTAQNLTGYMLDLLVQRGYRGVTMGECMGEPESNWYRAANGRVPTSSPTVTTASSTASATGTSTAPTSLPTGPTSEDGSCGPTNGNFNCIGFELGECCSQYGWCGSTIDHCGTGCQAGFGKCGENGMSSSSSSSEISSTATSTSSDVTSSTATATETSSAPTSTPTGETSLDGSCGGDNGYSCIGFELGECCSQYGWCGATTDHCGEGCNPLFGNCGGSSSSSSSVSASATETSSSETSSSTSTEASSTETSSATESSSATETSSETSATETYSATETSSEASATETSSETSATVTSSETSATETSNVSTTETSTEASATETSTEASATETSTETSATQSSTEASSTEATSTPAPTGGASSTPCTTKTPTPTSTPQSPRPTGKKSRDGRCGGRKGQHCLRYYEGECCSNQGWCGSSKDHCVRDCNPLYGKCGRENVKHNRPHY